MVQFAIPGNFRPDSEPPCSSKAAVKLEIEDPLDEEHGPLKKKSKLRAPFQQQLGTGSSIVSSQAMLYSPLDEPSPLGLRLRKSPSLLDLIHARLSQVNYAAPSCTLNSEDFEVREKDLKSTAVSTTIDKLKASNFPISLLRIGTWECLSRYEGDLVAKCYFAKHKLVWEVLDGSLKSKIEIQWADITALKAACPENEPGTLDIVLARQPLFFRETNPQPRKHTLWQATSDFTGGQASIHRRHFLQCQPGLLSKHFEKLIQCDPRLNSLSRQLDVILESPFFEPRCSMFEDPDGSKCHGFDNLKEECGSTFSGLGDPGSSCAAPTSSTKNEVRDSVGRAPDFASRESPSPSSVMDTRAIEENASIEMEELKDPKWDHFKVPGLRSSMSVSDLMSHIGHCISEQKTSGNPLVSGDDLPNRDTLEEISQYLLSDSQLSSASDERSLMSKVNSLYCLIQKDTASTQNLQINCGSPVDDDGTDEEPDSMPEPTYERKQVLLDAEEEYNDASVCKQQANISRKESFGELLMHLPRIASLPQFLFNFSEDAEKPTK